MIRRMRTGAALALAAVLSFAVVAAAQDVADDAGMAEPSGPTLRMNMADVVSLTLRNNLSVRVQYLDRVLAKYRIDKAEAKFEPTVNIDGSANLEAIRRNREVSGHSKSGSESNQNAKLDATVVQKVPTGATLTFGWENGYTNDAATDLEYSQAAGDVSRTNSRTDNARSTLSAEIVQPLLKGAGIDYNMASVKLARISEERSVLNLRDNLSSLVNEGVNAFFAFVEAKENLDIRRQALDRSRRLLDINRLKMDLGRMSQSDVTQAEADVASQELSLEQARNTYDQTRRDLLNHLDMDPEMQIQPAMEGYRDLHPKRDECLAVARERNRAYLDKVFSVSEAEIRYLVAENERKWDLSVKAGVGRGNGKENPGRAYTDTETHVGLNLTAPVNLWGEDYLDRKQILLDAATERRRSRVELKQAETDLQTKVANTVRNVNMRLKFIALSKRNTALQKTQLDNENTKLMAGRSTNFQVVTYQSQLVQAQQEEVASIISYLQALLELDQLLGTTMKTWKIDFRQDDKQLEQELDDEVRPLVWSWW